MATIGVQCRYLVEGGCWVVAVGTRGVDAGSAEGERDGSRDRRGCDGARRVRRVSSAWIDWVWGSDGEMAVGAEAGAGARGTKLKKGSRVTRATIAKIIGKRSHDSALLQLRDFAGLRPGEGAGLGLGVRVEGVDEEAEVDAVGERGRVGLGRQEDDPLRERGVSDAEQGEIEEHVDLDGGGGARGAEEAVGLGVLDGEIHGHGDRVEAAQEEVEEAEAVLQKDLEGREVALGGDGEFHG
jgi:hypothetical protein